MKNPLIFLSFFLFFNLYSQNTYEHNEGKFTIDLPKGFELSAFESNVYTFENKDAKRIIIAFFDDQKTHEELHALALNGFNAAGIQNTIAVSPVQDMMMNGNPSRMGFYKGQYNQNTAVNLYSLLGGVDFPDGGLYFLSILNDQDIGKKFNNVIEKACQTIRVPGKPLTGATDIREADVSTMPSPAVSGGVELTDPFVWNQESVSFSFQEGWSEKEMSRGFAKETIGWFDHAPTGGNMQVYCYQGMIWSPKTVGDVAGSVILAVIPDATLKGSEKVKIAGKNAEVKKYSGTVVSDGQTIPLGGVTIVYKGGKCNLMLLGMCPIANMDALVSAMIAVADTAQ